jgi:hypothetical protein
VEVFDAPECSSEQDNAEKVQEGQKLPIGLSFSIHVGLPSAPSRPRTGGSPTLNCEFYLFEGLGKNSHYQVIGEALRAYLGLELLERIGHHSKLKEDQARRKSSAGGRGR